MTHEIRRYWNVVYGMWAFPVKGAFMGAWGSDFKRWVVGILMPAVVLSLSIHPARADVCATVKIEILQEAVLERSAFEARMKVKNALSDPLEKFRVDLSIKDSHGNDAWPRFFVKLQSREGVDAVDGTTDVPPDSEPEIRWLLIPSPGAGGAREDGATYLVGAAVGYIRQGEHEVVNVAPDTILVLPQPELLLDYFIPSQVYGDDPFTTEKEPPVPYSLGVRVRNNGSGAAENLRIDTGQPEIVDNEQGLRIEFRIVGSRVNGEAGKKSFRVDFGAIDPGACSNARWEMICTLSGKFIAFKTSFTHADELGGQLTSLVQGTESHLLIHDVVVDFPGRDEIKDFLANVDDSPSSPIKVYESDCLEMDVADLSDQAAVAVDGDAWRLSFPGRQGAAYIRVEDPAGGERLISSLVRSDGKRMRSENAWLSKEYILADHTWKHHVNVFDVNPTGDYILSYGEYIESDRDDDGMPDEWEQQIVDADPDIDDIHGVSPGDDFDGDGETNLEEYENSVDPTDALSTTRGDIDGDKTITLADAVIALRIVSGMDAGGATITVGGDIDGDNLIGLPEAAYILQALSGLRKTAPR